MTTTEEQNKHDCEIVLGDQIIDFYAKLANGGEAEDEATNLTDVLTALMHWAHGYDIDFWHLLNGAENRFDEELAEGDRKATVQ